MVSHRSGDFGLTRLFDSEGYYRLRESERGSVDEPPRGLPLGGRPD